VTALFEQTMLPVGPLAKPCSFCAGIGTLTATDIFCGAGGSSLGLEAVCCPQCGRQLIQVTQALNHSKLAVEAHNLNFPHADHDVNDIQDLPASRFRRTDILWSSNECTHHAYCRGPKAYDEDAIRSRATFHDVVRFTEFHRYDAVIVENVIEARLWCDVPGHKKKCSCGSSFNSWYASMTALGYEGRVVYFNSQFALPTPQSRDRIYIVFWRDGLPAPPLDFRPVSWCSCCEAVVRGVQTWKPTRKGTVRAQNGMFEWGRYGIQYVYRCPECAHPVAPAVTGAKSIINWSLPMHRIADRPKKPKTRERILYGARRVASMQPLVVHVGGHLYERRPGVRVWAVDDPLRTIAASKPYMALVTPAGGQEAHARDVGEPMHTIVGSDRLALTVRYGGQGAAPRAIGEPTQTITAHDREIGLVIQNMENNLARSTAEPTPPVTTGGNHMLVQVNRSTKGKPVDRQAQDLEVPTRTVAGHGELALVEFRGKYGTARSVEVPAHTVTAQGQHHGLLVYNGVPGFVRDVGDAAGTVTSRDKQSLLVPYYRTGVARPLQEPVGTVTSKDREALVEITDADIDDWWFRMLHWSELLRAQAPFDHLDGRPYELTARVRGPRGRFREVSSEQRVKWIGNMVSAPVATMLGEAVVASLMGVDA
jgi:DNA (cytosine-5)-methyltransferase 1